MKEKHKDEYTVMGYVTAREVYCPKCKVYSDSNIREPKCNKCNSTLITVVFSALDGSRITGGWVE